VRQVGPEQVPQGVGVALRLLRWGYIEALAAGTEAPLPPFDHHAVGLHLQVDDAELLVHQHHVELEVAIAAPEADVGQHEPAVAQAVPERLHHPPLGVVGETRQGEVLGDQHAHVDQLATVPAGAGLVALAMRRARSSRAGSPRRRRSSVSRPAIGYCASTSIDCATSSTGGFMPVARPN